MCNFMERLSYLNKLKLKWIFYLIKLSNFYSNVMKRTNSFQIEQ